MQKSSMFLVVAVVALLIGCKPAEDVIDLAGEWEFQVDREDIGVSSEWFKTELTGLIHLPGSMASNGLGDDITMETQWMGGMRNPEWYLDPNYAPYHHPDHVRLPYWLQPDKKYTGAAWYRKEIIIPESWSGHSFSIFLERVHWESTLYFDDQLIGTQNSLGTAHEYLLPVAAVAGSHTITLRIDNRMKEVDVGWDSHSVSDHTQSNWNGIVGDMQVRKIQTVRLEEPSLIVLADQKTVEVMGTLINGTDKLIKAKIDCRLVPVMNEKTAGNTLSRKLDLVIQPGSQSLSFQIHGEDSINLWDEFDPVLYQAEIKLIAPGLKRSYSLTTGFRTIESRPTGIFVNNQRTFLRGTLECAIFPETGYPATNPDDWRRIMDVVKDHGLNHIRFHSWCPPDAAFQAADEKGIYLQVECSSWANSTSAIGDGKPIDQFIWDESKRIMERYGHHPSFIMMAYGNEPAGQNQVAFLSDFVNYWQEQSPNRLYTSAAGWPQIHVNDYHNIPQPRIQGWGEQLNSIINAQPPSSSYDWSEKIANTVKKPVTQISEDHLVIPALSRDLPIPVVSHEIGQWCVYPDFKEIDQYAGVLKARNFEIFRESLDAHGMLHLADSFLLASGKLQALCYKADIEAALRTSGFGGFQLLDLHDFPGQGTALVGVLNPFWREKGYISPEEFRQFCNEVVPLARIDKHLVVEGDTLRVPLQVAHYSKTQDLRPMTQIRIKTEEGEIEVEQTIETGELKRGGLNDIGVLNYPLEVRDEARMLVLELQVGEYVNSWNIFVYPKAGANLQDDQVKVVTEINEETLTELQAGGKVLLSLGQGRVSEDWGGKVGVGFSSIFWNTAWTGGQKPHTLGILCNPDHPALNDFPTRYYSDWNWWDMMSNADAIQLDSLAEWNNPIVRIIDDWVSNRQLALVMEARVGKGKLIISGANLHSNLGTRPAAAQLRRSLVNYLDSQACQPDLVLSSDQLSRIIR